MDFIIKLLKLRDLVIKDVFNLIIIIINKLIKYAIMIPYKETYKVDQLGYILLDKLIRDYSIPKSIILDKDRLFTSYYQKTLIAIIRTKL